MEHVETPSFPIAWPLVLGEIVLRRVSPATPVSASGGTSLIPGTVYQGEAHDRRAVRMLRIDARRPVAAFLPDLQELRIPAARVGPELRGAHQGRAHARPHRYQCLLSRLASQGCSRASSTFSRLSWKFMLAVNRS